jgi:hypothetical protein
MNPTILNIIAGIVILTFLAVVLFYRPKER